jgi:peptidoglycan/xylan/chitin deacetylase (PgdA/CDA1 family)
MSGFPVLMYHAVDTAVDPYAVQVSPGRLRQQLQTLRRLGYRGVSMQDLFGAGGSADRLVGLTFDDGYADFADTAVPILDELGFTATVFVVAGQLGGTNEWDDPPRRALMRADQVRAVHAAGHEVGSHGMNHVRLVGMSAERVSHELVESKAVLEEIIESPVSGFCYPYGVLDPRTVRQVQDVYDYACGVAVRPSGNRWAIPRFHVGQRDTPLWIAAKLALRPARERFQWGTRCV